MAGDRPGPDPDFLSPDLLNVTIRIWWPGIADTLEGVALAVVEGEEFEAVAEFPDGSERWPEL